MLFGVWFKSLIDDYNRKLPSSQIAHTDDNHNSYGWVFYVVTAVLGRKRHIDPELTFEENKVKEKKVIIAKRTTYQENAETE